MMDIKEQVKEIKQSFRLMMDGAVAKSMREKGLEYKLNWGATLPRLREELRPRHCPLERGCARVQNPCHYDHARR